jgi:hypothetical protein
MRRTTHARSARDAQRPIRAVHLRAASVIALAALGVGAAPAVAAPLAGTHSAIVTADSGVVSDNGGSDDGDADINGDKGDDSEPDGVVKDSGDSSSTPTQSQSGASDSNSSEKAENDDSEEPKDSDGKSGAGSSATGNPGEPGGSPSKGQHSVHARLTSNPVSPGADTTLRLWGFTPSTKVTVSAMTDPNGKTVGESQNVTTGPGGGERVAISVPKTAPDGSYTITADSEGDGTATAELTVKSPDEASDPSIALESQTVAAGKNAHVTGKDFPSGKTVTVKVTDTNQQSIGDAASSTASTRGEISSDIKVPDTATPGDGYTVTASFDGGKPVTAPLTVTAPPSSGGGADDEPTTNKPTNGTPTSDTPSSSNTPPSSSSTSDAPSSSASDPSTTEGTHSASTTSEVPPATSTRDRSKEIELSAPSDDSSSKSTDSEKPEKKDTAEKPTKDEESEKAKDEDKKTSDTPQETSDQPVSEQTDAATEAAATMDDDPTTSGPTTVTTQDDGGGPLVKLFSSIGGEDASGMDRIRQVFIATLGVGFLTALGFTTASWLSRRSGTHSARAGLRQLFRRH